ncbi:MAG: hypothetical protein ACREJN_02515 [Nitrospiraceae bacterium]
MMNTELTTSGSGCSLPTGHDLYQAAEELYQPARHTRRGRKVRLTERVELVYLIYLVYLVSWFVWLVMFFDRNQLAGH